MTQEHTLARPFRCEGIGLRGGRPVSVEVRPAPVGAGRRFVCGGVSIPAAVESVVDTRLATTLGRGEARVSMVEHLCAALHACGVDNVEMLVEGGEIPALDGSARLWVEAIRACGVRPQGARRRVARVIRDVRVRVGESEAALSPGPGFVLDIAIAFDHPCIGAQRYSGSGTGESFRADLAWARTFGFFRDAEPLRLAGITQGVSLDNTVVYDTAGVMNPGGLRSPDEAVRHKALDAVGDLSLLGHALHGRLSVTRAGHAIHLALLTALRSTDGAVDWG